MQYSPYWKGSDTVDNKNEIGERIKQVIAEQGITQAEFAQRLNISQSMVSKICSGAAEPSFRTISDICKTFGVDVIWLETGCGQMHSVDAEDNLLAVFTGQTLGGINHPIYRQFMIALSEASYDELWAILKFARRLVAAEEIKKSVRLSNCAQKETAPEVDPEQQTEKAPDATNIQD